MKTLGRVAYFFDTKAFNPSLRKFTHRLLLERKNSDKRVSQGPLECPKSLFFSSSAERVWVQYSNRTQSEVHFTRFTQIQHGFLAFRKAFRLSTTLPLKTPTIFNSLEEIDKMARHRNYRNYAYEDGTVNSPLI